MLDRRSGERVSFAGLGTGYRMVLELLMDGGDCWVQQMGVGRSDDWMADGAGTELYVVLSGQVECEGSGYWERCRLEAADCTPG